ncbi:TrbG/VirB9 family P-type conjugative transfer protein [Parasphingorhabdus sp.]|jgi:type IV secretion system protein VirB9|uniref:TrbG/VirB9 family P-type conjugative transfer protein n=1 Tax=Parasphingorhabdus sp. TaxID=2709688 RepID=UPI003BB0DDF3
MKWLAFLLLLMPAPIAAQFNPSGPPGDPRFQTLIFQTDMVYSLNVEPGYQTAIIFAASEEVQSIALGDNSAWQVNPSGRGDMVFIRAGAGALATNMTIITDARIYVFDLTAGSGASSYIVRFDYPALDTGNEFIGPDDASGIKGLYRLSGTRALYPTGMEDDGRKTYISWPASAMMPAVFAKDATGKEQVVDGQIRGGMFVIDRVYPKIIFRLDKKKATARRKAPVK